MEQLAQRRLQQLLWKALHPCGLLHGIIKPLVHQRLRLPNHPKLHFKVSAEVRRTRDLSLRHWPADHKQESKAMCLETLQKWNQRSQRPDLEISRDFGKSVELPRWKTAVKGNQNPDPHKKNHDGQSQALLLAFLNLSYFLLTWKCLLFYGKGKKIIWPISAKTHKQL